MEMYFESGIRFTEKWYAAMTWISVQPEDAIIAYEAYGTAPPRPFPVTGSSVKKGNQEVGET